MVIINTKAALMNSFWVGFFRCFRSLLSFAVFLLRFLRDQQVSLIFVMTSRYLMSVQFFGCDFRFVAVGRVVFVIGGFKIFGSFRYLCWS